MSPEPSNVNDTVPAGELLVDLSADKLLADRAYDSDAVLEQARQQKMEAVIPSRKCRRHQREYDAHVYKEPHLLECLFLQSSIYFGQLQPAMVSCSPFYLKKENKKRIDYV